MPAKEADQPPADRRLTGSTGRRVLVCAAARPPTGTGRSVDVRFGDRAACRRLLGGVTTAAIERRLAATASAAEATLVTWTHRPRRELDGRPYDVVDEGTNRSG